MPKFSFVWKLAAAMALTAAADFLFYDKAPGSTLGLFALLWIAGLAVAVPATRKRPAARIALALAALPALAMADQPGPLTAVLFWAALSSAVILSRRDFHDAAQHALRLVLQGVVGLIAPLRDAMRLVRLPKPHLRHSLLKAAAALAVPLAGGAIFLTLFASANPLVERMLPDITFPSLDFALIFFTLAVFTGLWAGFRPSRVAVNHRFGIGKPTDLPGVTALSILISLFLFNAIFALENGLDIAFLWSGAPLPHGVTLADYAHRGAYPLIATALLAGAFVLVTAHPDTEVGRHPLIRRLVVVWTAQNLILVASSIIRTVDYIDAYMLTSLRIAALVWMGLVAAGLVLICLRMMWGRSLAWLINAVAAAAMITLFCSSLVDFDEVTAEWNVSHASEVRGPAAVLDVGYLGDLGPSAVVALARLEKSPRIDSALRGQITALRERAEEDMRRQQERPYGWTWRNARRLDAVQALLGNQARTAQKAPCGPNWNGTMKNCAAAELTLAVKP